VSCQHCFIRIGSNPLHREFTRRSNLLRLYIVQNHFGNILWNVCSMTCIRALAIRGLSWRIIQGSQNEIPIAHFALKRLRRSLIIPLMLHRYTLLNGGQLCRKIDISLMFSILPQSTIALNCSNTLSFETGL